MGARQLAVINQKGGVGKTTTTINLAHALALAGNRVLAVDLDPQGQLSLGFGPQAAAHAGIDRVLLDGLPLEQAGSEARERLRIVPAGTRLSEVEYMMEGGAQRGFLLAEALKSVAGRYDYIFIDAPPSTGLIAMNALIAAEEVLLPVTGEFLGLHGTSRFLQILEHIDDSLNRKTRVWIALTRFNERRRLAADVRSKLLEYFPNSVLATPVRESLALAESPGVGKTIFEYRSRNKGAEDYSALAQDLVERRTIQ